MSIPKGFSGTQVNPATEIVHRRFIEETIMMPYQHTNTKQRRSGCSKRGYQERSTLDTFSHNITHTRAHIPRVHIFIFFIFLKFEFLNNSNFLPHQARETRERASPERTAAKSCERTGVCNANLSKKYIYRGRVSMQTVQCHCPSKNSASRGDHKFFR